jgi:hypothetical protein
VLDFAETTGMSVVAFRRTTVDVPMDSASERPS